MYSEQSSGGGSMDVDLNDLATKARPTRAKPYSKPKPLLPYTKSDPDAANRWGHDLFGASVPGGNLAHRLSAAQKIAIRDGSTSAPSAASLDLRGKDLLDDDLDLRGNGAGKARAGAGGARASLVSRVGGASAAAANGGRSSPAVAASSGPGLSIKGKSNRTIVEVSNLDIGTTAEDVKATFESFGNIVSSRLGPRHPSSVTVILEFTLPTAAQASITAFDGQIADGRTISVKFKAQSPSSSPAPALAPKVPTGPRAPQAAAAPRREPAATAPGNNLLSRLGLPSVVRAGGPRKEVASQPAGDLMAGISGSSGMYSDAINDPRASVQTVPGRSGSSGGRGGGRGGRGGRGRGGVRGVGGMQVD